MSESWFGKFKQRPNPQLRVFCLPFAGGSAAIYRDWDDAFPEEIELRPIQLPGRENRISDPPLTDMDALCEALSPVLLPLMDKPYVFFGHSMGALIAFYLCRHFRARRYPMPVVLFAAGRAAPQLPSEEEVLHHLDHDAFIAGLRRLNGTPEAILQNEELMELMLPAIRADFELYETKPYQEEAPLEVPITCYGGLKDTDATPEQLEAWRDQTTGKFIKRMFPGKHFFLIDNRAMTIATLKRDLTRLL